MIIQTISILCYSCGSKGQKKGSARAVEESEEGEDDPALPIPNTGVFTGEGGSAVMIDSILLIAVTVGVIAAAWLLIKQAERD